MKRDLMDEKDDIFSALAALEMEKGISQLSSKRSKARSLPHIKRSRTAARATWKCG